MKHRLFLLPLLLCLAILSCRQRFYRAASAGMENTIMTGQSFYVQPADAFDRGDIAVFDYYGNDYSSADEITGGYKQHREKRIYRLVAYSGDIIELKDGDLFVNKRHVPLPYTAKTVYELRSTVVIEDLEELLIPYGEQIQRKGDTIIYQVGLSEKQAAEFRQRKPAVLSVRRSRYDYQVADSFFARSSANDHWSSDNYGPLKIPSPGDTVEITAGNYKLYKNIPGIAVGKHPVTEKLYFLLGDNRNGAEDSRYMGLVPHSKMYGIVKK